MSLTDTEKHWLWGCAVATAASRSDVNVAMPHLRGKWSPTKAILRTLEASFFRHSFHSSRPTLLRAPTESQRFVVHWQRRSTRCWHSLTGFSSVDTAAQGRSDLGLLPRIPENKPTEPRGWIALDEAIFERVAQDRPCSGEDVAQVPARWARKAVGSCPSTPSKAPVQPQPSRPPPGQECHPWLGRFRTLDDVSLALQV